MTTTSADSFRTLLSGPKGSVSSDGLRCSLIIELEGFCFPKHLLKFQGHEGCGCLTVKTEAKNLLCTSVSSPFSFITGGMTFWSVSSDQCTSSSSVPHTPCFSWSNLCMALLCSSQSRSCLHCLYLSFFSFSLTSRSLPSHAGFLPP